MLLCELCPISEFCLSIAKMRLQYHRFVDIGYWGLCNYKLDKEIYSISEKQVVPAPKVMTLLQKNILQVFIDKFGSCCLLVHEHGINLWLCYGVVLFPTSRYYVGTDTNFLI